MRNKKYLMFIASIMLMQLLSACTAQERQNKAGSSSDEYYGQSVQGEAISTKLAIGNGCIGCGRCIMVDYEHFSYPQVGYVPVVISQNNLTSKNLQDAIRICPVGVISVS